MKVSMLTAAALVVATGMTVAADRMTERERETLRSVALKTMRDIELTAVEEERLDAYARNTGLTREEMLERVRENWETSELPIDQRKRMAATMGFADRTDRRRSSPERKETGYDSETAAWYRNGMVVMFAALFGAFGLLLLVQAWRRRKLDAREAETYEDYFETAERPR